MKYCADCSAENSDANAACTACGGKELIDQSQMKARGLPLPHDLDTRKFMRAGTADDPLMSERMSAALSEAKIPNFARPRRAGTVDGITSPATSPWWEILVPEEALEKATQILEEEREGFEREAEANAKAAEEEATATVPREDG